ncbi:MAG: head-tail connector protein [Pseudomonadota bacterium]
MLKQTVAPAVEPISLAEAKAFLRVDADAEDTLIDSLIVTSRLHVEAALDLALITQSWRLTAHASDASHTIQLHPVVAVTGTVSIDADGNETPVGTGEVDIDLDQRPARICIRAAANAVKVGVDFDAGFGATADDVPAPIRHALLQLVAHWFEHREPVAIGTDAARIPDSVSALLAPYRAIQI